MEYATKEAIENIENYTSDSLIIESINLYLSEYPIGDEYGYWNESDISNGESYLKWCKERGIKVFE